MNQQKELHKALNLSLWSLVGWIIPLVGLILAIVALRLAQGVPNSTHARSKKNIINIVATIGIILSIVAGFLWFNYYQDQREQAKIQLEQKQAEELESQLEQFRKQSSLDNCLQKADESYNQYLEINSTDTRTDENGQKIYYMQQYQWDYVNNKRTSDKDECYRRYPL